MGPAGVRNGFVFLAAAVPLISGRYYADIRQTIPASDQEMNSILAELSRVRPSVFWVGHRPPAMRVLPPSHCSFAGKPSGPQQNVPVATVKDQGSQHLITDEQGLVLAAAT